MMMKKNLKVYAGALLLVGALTSCGISLVNELPNSDLSIDSSVSLQEEPIACQFSDYVLEDGTIAHALPVGYEPYYINDDMPMPSVLQTVLETKNYVVYLGDLTVTYSDGQKIDNSLNGFVGVNEAYLSSIRQLDELYRQINMKALDITHELAKYEDNYGNSYFLPTGYFLYNLNGYIDNTLSHYMVAEGTVYQIPEDSVENFVGINSDCYEMIQDLQPLKDQVEDIYYEGKVYSRG